MQTDQPKQPFYKNRRLLVISGIVLIVVIIVIAFSRRTIRHFQAIKQAVQGQPTLTGSNSSQLNQKTIALAESSLNGERVEESVVNRRPLAVVVENHPDARPQRGLSEASIIYEAIAEGGITRFLTIFGPHSAVKVGPVRSARSYFIDWLLEYDALFAHVGGSQEALQKIRDLKVKDLDQFGLGEKAYKREPQEGKATEHTMFTTTDKLWEAAKTIKKFDTTTFPTSPLLWKEDEIADSRPKAQTITIPFSSDSYEVKWEYDHPSNTYKRILAGKPHTDGNTGKQLTAKTVIIQEVMRENVVTDQETGVTVWRMTTTGSGAVKVIQDGGVIEGTWKKPNQTTRTRFYDKNGNEIKLNRGLMWFEIIPPGTVVTITNPEPSSTPTPSPTK